MLYADTEQRKGAFHRHELLFARDCANWLECCLEGRDSLSKPEPEDREPESSLRLAPACEKLSKERPRRSTLFQPTVSDRVRPESLMVFFRSLSALTQAGVTIDSSLTLLGKDPEGQAMAKVSDGLAKIVTEGEPLSAAMERYPGVFKPAVRSTICLGERTGRLDHVLDVLAVDLEKNQQLAYRLRGALTYPAFLSVACGLILLLGPPYLLEGHLKMLSESGVALPLATRLLIGLSALLRSPLVLIFIGVLIAGALFWIRSEKGSQKLRDLAHHGPIIGGVLELLDMTLFVRALSMQLRAGMTAMEALSLSRQGCQDPALREALYTAERFLRDGETLCQSFRRTGKFDQAFLGFIESGESTGKLEDLVSWLGDFYEKDFEARIDGLVAMAEPVIMAVMGCVTAVLLIATIKPSLLLLQTL